MYKEIRAFLFFCLFVLSFFTPVDVYENSDGYIYLSTDKGLYIVDEHNNNLQILPLPQLQDAAIYQVLAIDSQMLLGISGSGLFLYNCKKRTKTVPQIRRNGVDEKLTHSNRQYNCLYKDSRGLIWIGTQDGLNVWNPQTHYTESFYTEDGLINNSIKSIIEDRLGQIWVSTSNGICCITVDQQADSYQYIFANFNTYDGVVDYEFIERSVFQSADGTLFWGGIDGFNQICTVQTVDQAQQQHLLAPLFLKMQLFGTDVKIGESCDGNIILDKSITVTQKLELNYNQNYLSFYFSAMNYTNPTQTYYRYKLEGVDETWHEILSTDGTGRASYTNLRTGEYILNVCASSSNKIWNDNYTQLAITIHPPFWRTTTAYVVYISICLFIALYAVFRYLRWSKNKLIQQQNERLEKMKLRFYTNISHELRTPLTLIVTPLDSILKKIEEGYLKIQLKNILRNANDLLDLVNQLLDFRRLEVVGETLHLSYFSLNEFITITCASFESLGVNTNISFQLECMSDDLHIHADKNKLQRIIYNLLSNAYKFTPSGGKIMLKSSKGYMPGQAQKAFIISVQDTGCGISDKGKIFTLFYQGKEKEQLNTGSGIGLHLAQEYAALHGGVITVDSEINNGSLFSLYIPLNLMPDQLLPNDKADSDKFVSQPFKILVVEDNDDFRSFLVNQLSESYHVVEAINGKEGLTQVGAYMPDLIISDIMMPEMDGIELCNKVKTNVETSHIPVILLTAKASDNAQIEGYTVGADAYITKPFNMDILSLRIKHLLEQHEGRKKIFKNAIIINPETITNTSLDEQLIRKALEYIDQNLDNTAYSVDQLSKDMNMDRTGLYRKLTSIIGQTPSAFIRSVRLKKAAQLLKQHYPVSEVADLVGFGTVSYFSKCFQEEFGMKPSRYTKTENE